MKDERFFVFPKTSLLRGLIGYVLIIALALIIFPIKGQEFAVNLANGIAPLAFFAIGEALFDLLDYSIFLILRKSNQSAEET